MTGPERRKHDRMSYAEIAGLMRRGYVRPIPEPLPLHVMAARRGIVPVGTDSPPEDSTTTERNQEN